jgi:hypothetical protein
MLYGQIAAKAESKMRPVRLKSRFIDGLLATRSLGCVGLMKILEGDLYFLRVASGVADAEALAREASGRYKVWHVNVCGWIGGGSEVESSPWRTV